MGLFDWLFRRRESARVAVTDRVWLTGEARTRAVVKELRKHVAADRSVVLLAHFPDSLAAFGPKLIATGLPHEPLPDNAAPADVLRLAVGAPRVLFGLVRGLRLGERPTPDAADDPPPVVLAERHFPRKHDDRAAEFAAGLGERAAITVHAAMDDPLMKIFAGEWVTDILKRLGMQEDEAIESAMVARRIRRAQGNFGSMAKEVPADSAEEWLRLNAAGWRGGRIG